MSRRGALTGGYYDARTSRLALQKRLRELENAIHNETETSNNLKTSLQKTGILSLLFGQEHSLISCLIRSRLETPLNADSHDKMNVVVT